MRGVESFLDSNVLLYLLSSDPQKAATSDRLIEAGATVSIQVLNEFANVASRKYRWAWSKIGYALDGFKQALNVRPLTLEVHELGLRIAERYRLSFYDSLLLAAALQAGCTTFYSEDLQDGQVIENTLTIRNPFR